MSASTKSTPKKRRDWKPAFLRSLAADMTVTEACEAAGISRDGAYKARQADEDFALAWADVEEKSTESMEREAYRRAVEGTDKPVFQGKELVGHVREYSDTLLIFMLKSRRPERYRDNVKVEHGGRVEHKVSGLEELTDDALLDRLGQTA